MSTKPRHRRGTGRSTRRHVGDGFEVLGSATEERVLMAVALLAFVGILLASYLTYEHWQIANGGATSCSVNAVFDCDPVLHSPYASVLGIPLAVLGLAGFAAIEVLVLWRFLFIERPVTRVAPLLLAGLCVGGVALGTYLTALELFVIHALCPYCVSSFVVMVVLSGVLAWTYWDYGMATLAKVGR